MAKVFYDATVNKEVCDCNGTMTKQDCVDNHGFSSVGNTQEVTVNGTTAVSEVVAGTLQTFDSVAREAQAVTDKETARQAAEDAFKTSQGWSDQDYNDFKASL
jgi:hypothetical protein